jgi:hypothetical protein
VLFGLLRGAFTGGDPSGWVIRCSSEHINELATEPAHPFPHALRPGNRPGF